MTVAKWYETIIAAHLAVTDAVSHAQRLQSDRYFVWEEDGRNDLEGDGAHVETAVSGSTDLYTKQEFDPWGDALGVSFDTAGISWSLVLVEFEEDTGFYHWSWDWEVV